MVYHDSRYPAVVRDLGLTADTSPDLFAGVPPVPAGPSVQAALTIGSRLGPGAHTEFSRAVWMVGPVLGDFWWRYRGRITLIGGADLPGDPDAGLAGTSTS